MKVVCEVCGNTINTNKNKPKERLTLRLSVEEQESMANLSIDNWHSIILEALITNSFSGAVAVPDIRDAFRTALAEAGEINDDEKSIRKITSQQTASRLNELGFKRSKIKSENRLHYYIDKKTLEHQAYIYLKNSEVYRKYAEKNKLDEKSYRVQVLEFIKNNGNKSFTAIQAEFPFIKEKELLTLVEELRKEGLVCRKRTNGSVEEK